jgi:hypothetical protein
VAPVSRPNESLLAFTAVLSHLRQACWPNTLLALPDGAVRGVSAVPAVINATMHASIIRSVISVPKCEAGCSFDLHYSAVIAIRAEPAASQRTRFYPLELINSSRHKIFFFQVTDAPIAAAIMRDSMVRYINRQYRLVPGAAAYVRFHWARFSAEEVRQGRRHLFRSAAFAVAAPRENGK